MSQEQLPARGPIEFRTAQIASVDFEERVIELIAAPYNEETDGVVRGPDGKLLRELIEAGAFEGIETRNDHVTVNRDHDYGRTVGKAIEYRHDDPRGLIARLKVSNTPLGDETLQLAADGVLKASVGMAVRRHDQSIRNGLRRIKRAFLDHIALVPNPAYRGASVLAVRQSETETRAQADEAATPNLDAIIALLDES